MKQLVLSAWAWVVAHPREVIEAILAVLTAIAAATVANARAKGRPVGWFARFVDRLAARTRANAANAGWSIPIFGKSVFEAAVDASAPPSDPPPVEATDDEKPSDLGSIYVYRDDSARCWVATPRKGGALRPSARGATPEAAKEALRALMQASEPGFVHYWVLAAIALAVILVGLVLVPGCSPAQSLARSVQPIALHEVVHPEYGACHEVGARAASRTLQRELIVYAGACLGRIDGGAAGDAAVSE